MIFYKGALSYETLISMPYPKLFRLQEHANKINKAKDAEINKNSSNANWKKL